MSHVEQAANALAFGTELALSVMAGVVLLAMGSAWLGSQLVGVRRPRKELAVGTRVKMLLWEHWGTVVAHTEPYNMVDGGEMPQVRVRWDLRPDFPLREQEFALWAIHVRPEPRLRTWLRLTWRKLMNKTLIPGT